MLTIIQEVFIQEEELNLIKESEFYGILSHFFPLLFPYLSSNLENKQLCSHSESTVNIGGQ